VSLKELLFDSPRQ